MGFDSGSDNWDENFEGDLITIKGPRRFAEPDYQELETIRPYPIKPKTNHDLKPPAPTNLIRKRSMTLPQRPKTANKNQPASKFALPTRPAALFREQTIEDYSDLYFENESVFDRRMSATKVAFNPTYVYDLSITNGHLGRLAFSKAISSIRLDKRAEIRFACHRRKCQETYYATTRCG